MAKPTSPFAKARTPDRFALTGRSIHVDGRIDAARRDLADVRLASRIFAPHYAAAIPRSAIAQAPILSDPSDANPISEILPGERFELLEQSRGLAWGVSSVDGVVGYVDAEALDHAIEATHIVASVAAPVRADPDRDAEIVSTLPMGAMIANIGGGDWRAAAGGFVALADLRAPDSPAFDPADTAERLIGVPHRAGGRSGAGVNCSGLVFLCLHMAGIAAPRFCDLQARALGDELPEGAALERGDLVWFADHAAILADAQQAIHAAPGGVVRESLDAIVGAYGPIVARRRVG